MSDIVSGQKVAFQLDAAGKLLNTGRQTMCRGLGDSVKSWQVTLAPVFVDSVGPQLSGMPAWRATPTAPGLLAVVMRFGGGGVSFETVFDYPVNGASFSVSGDNITIDVIPGDTTTVFTAATKPACLGWIKPLATTGRESPLVLAVGVAIDGLIPLYPFTRALLLTEDDPANPATVTFRDPSYITLANPTGIVMVVALAAGFGVKRIPVPSQASTFAVHVASGIVQVAMELQFT